MSNNYWFCKFFVAKRDSQLYGHVLQWYQISVFARNISMACYLAFIYGMIALFFKPEPIDQGKAPLVFALTTFLLMAIMMAIRYYYCFVAYYSKGIYRAFVFLNLDEQIPSIPPSQNTDHKVP